MGIQSVQNYHIVIAREMGARCVSKKKAKSNKPYSTIEQHTRKGKTLVPPLLQLPSLKANSWLNERLPEMLWAALLVATIDRKTALATFRAVAKACEGTGGDVTHSGLAALVPDKRAEILGILSKSAQLRTALRPLLCLKELPGRQYWAEVLKAPPITSDWRALGRAVLLSMDHQSQEATDCRWVRVLSFILAGKLKLPTEEHVRELVYYPDYGDMRAVRPTIRATELGFDSAVGTKTVWPAAFWEQCRTDTRCETGIHLPKNRGVKMKTSSETIRKVRRALARHFADTATSTGVDAAHEGTFGMAMYSLAILDEVTRFGNSTLILGRMGLRTLLECYVTLAYLVERNDVGLWEAYRAYGIGQAKLVFLKLDDESIPTPNYVNVDALNILANEDQWIEFAKIDLGHWENANLRSMSDHAGVKVEYDRFYAWPSGFVHGNWGAVRTTVFDVCTNPLHRLHRVLKQEPASLDDVMSDACYLADKILELVDKTYPTFSERVGS